MLDHQLQTPFSYPSYRLILRETQSLNHNLAMYDKTINLKEMEENNNNLKLHGHCQPLPSHKKTRGKGSSTRCRLVGIDCKLQPREHDREKKIYSNAGMTTRYILNIFFCHLCM